MTNTLLYTDDGEPPVAGVYWVVVDDFEKKDVAHWDGLRRVYADTEGTADHLVGEPYRGRIIAYIR